MMCGILSLSGDYTNASILTNHPIEPVEAGSFFTPPYSLQQKKEQIAPKGRYPV